MTGKTTQATSNQHNLDSGSGDHKEKAQKVDQKTKQILEQEIAELETRMANLEARLPAHSIPPSMLAELDELEEQLIEAKARLAKLISLADK